MTFANVAARPRSCLIQSSNFMPRSLSHGYTKSISNGNYFFTLGASQIRIMVTVFVTRRARLHILIAKYGSVANLNKACGWEPNNPRLYQISNGSVRSDRGTPYELGDATAREIEQLLNLPTGWMDTPPTYAELHNSDHDNDPRVLAHKVMEDMPADKVRTALKLLSALAQPDEHGQAAAG